MDSKEFRNLVEAYSEVYAPCEKIEEKFVDPSHGPFDDPNRIGMKSPNRNMMDKHKKLMSKGDPESTARAAKIAKAKLQTTLRAYDNNVKESQYTTPPQAQQPPAEVRKAPKKAPNPVTTVGTGLAAAYVGNEIGKKLLKKKPEVKGVFEEVDIYDIVLSHLLDEGYADTIESAEAIMVNMSEEWREDIVEAYVDYRKGKLSSGRTPQQTLASRHERVKATAARERGAASSTDSLMTPATKRSQKLGQARREMDANTSTAGKVRKALHLGRRDNAGPSVQRGEPNTARHQQAIDARERAKKS